MKKKTYFFPMEHHLSVQIDERLKTKKSCAGVKEGHQRQTIRCKQEKQGDCLQKKSVLIHIVNVSNKSKIIKAKMLPTF